MHTQTIDYRGHSIIIAQDDSPENPFEAWDCEPPLVTYYGGRHEYFKAYKGAPENLREVMHLLPASTWERGNRVKFFKEHLEDHFTMKEAAQSIRDYGCTFDAFDSMLSEVYGSSPSSWGQADTWFDLVASMLSAAGIECVNTVSRGHSQGDVTLVLAIATPEWMKMTGVKPENAKEALQASIDLYSAWAWGDVYGVSEIQDENGDEIDGEPSCWGFYGSDHEKAACLNSHAARLTHSLRIAPRRLRTFWRWSLPINLLTPSLTTFLWCLSCLVQGRHKGARMRPPNITLSL